MTGQRTTLLLLAILFLGMAYPSHAPAQTTQTITAEEWDSAENALPLIQRALNARSIASIEAAAARGDGEALYLLGNAKLWGLNGVTINPVEARALLRRAVTRGFRRAALGYGSLLYRGEGGPKDIEEGLTWWEAAADAGQAAAMISLGDHYRFNATPPDVERARQYYQRAADLGSPSGRSRLADYVFYGIAQAENREGAVALYQEAADAGSTHAMVRLGAIYESGVGAPQDTNRALDLYLRAAANHNDAGAVAAAKMLINGLGVPADVPRAAQILTPFVGINWEATSMLARLVVNRTVPPIPGRDIEQLALLADEHGYPDALGSLMANLREGRNGYPRDLRRAAELARAGLQRAEARPLSQEGAWPMHAKGFAYTIQLALTANAITPDGDEAERLSRRYGAPGGRLLRFDTPAICGGREFPFHVYVWDVAEPPAPTEAQFEWLEQSRGCAVAPETRALYRRLLERAQATNRRYTDVTDENAHGHEAPLVGVIDF